MTNSASVLFKSSMRYGLFVGGALVAGALLFYLGFNIERLSLMQFSGLTILFGFVPMIVGIVLLMKRFRDKDDGGYLTYMDGLRFGTYLMFFAGIITATYGMVFNTIIDPGYDIKVQEIVLQRTVEYLEMAKIPDSDIEKQVKMLDTAIEESRKSSPLVTALWSIPQSGFYGLVISLIVAAIFKRKPDPFQQAMSEINDNAPIQS